ncbi:MAG: hypothetical protein DI527_18110 [Chelatococcus sp.]|nr:MAG: hypothetical protein DI527_18110 [Chelatococcus sp.]
MTPERAEEIVSAINYRAFISLGMADKAGSLDGVTLAEMLEAKSVVLGMNVTARERAVGDGTSYSTSVVPDDRLIAAVYVFEHYRPSREPILDLPHDGFLGKRKVLAVVAMAPDDFEKDEE